MKVSCSSSKTTTIPLRDNLDLTIKDDDEAPPPVPSHSDDAISDWIQSPCSGAKYRFLASGHIEVQDEGILRVSELPFGVGTWKELIEQVAEAQGISPALLAAVIAIESGGDPNLKSGSKMGLMQITYDIARKMSGSGKFVSEDQILHPSWNMIHGSKYLGKCLDSERNNIVGALAMYNQGSKSCKVSSECPDRWGLWTDCGYVDKVIALMNTAVDEGYRGVMFVDLGGEDVKQDGVLGMLFFGALAASAAYGIGTMLTKKGGRR